jgi:hypothetical protein
VAVLQIGATAHRSGHAPKRRPSIRRSSCGIRARVTDRIFPHGNSAARVVRIEKKK